MTAPDLTRTGCRVLDRDGDDETAGAYWETGYAEWKAVEVATRWATRYPMLAPFRVVDADGATLHTIYTEMTK